MCVCVTLGDIRVHKLSFSSLCVFYYSLKGFIPEVAMIERRREKVRDRKMQGRDLTVYQDMSTSHSFLTPKRNVLNSHPEARLQLEERSEQLT